MNFDLSENDNKNIVLIGMMGAGKSFIGSRLSRLLVHFSYVDIDDEIEKEAGMTISEIFEGYSEGYFRELETKIIKKYASGKNQIISTGGGAFENPKNQYALKENGLVFYLKATPKELFERIKKEQGEGKLPQKRSPKRPLLGDEISLQKIQTILKKREKNYNKAHFKIDTTQKQPYTILDEILKECHNYA